MRRGGRWHSLGGGLLALLAAGCADTTYLLGSVSGHLQILQAARPVDQWLADDSTPQPLKQRLQLAQQIRRFAVTALHLPDNPSYQRYADVQRRAAVWNVVAAPPFSLTLHQWCFPVAGCVGYRGYFDEQAAQQQAAALRTEGLEVHVYPVPAYSTLGWMNWAGGDPLLSTFIRYPEGELARMIFHELAHQVLYVKDDTAFNESFATAVERLGGARWLQEEAGAAARQEYAAFDARRKSFRALTRSTRQRLSGIYGPNNPLAPVNSAQAAMKMVAIADFQHAYARLKQDWGGYAAYDAWAAGANNASFGAQAAYDDWVDAFETLFARQHGDWQAFYGAVQALAELPKAERTLRLQTLQTVATAGHPP
ncbi:MAG: aminopeptidase [Burkholderiales bacterium RIFCSPLOWO2_12_FULL_61_40]|nr:MAG: aminopeptidase [Burkholderiales bacterium RIFCSPLOWO2_12_FULL_61_40]